MSIFTLNSRFQFPQSERTNCNCPPRRVRQKSQTLSVSTIGTNELQPCQSQRCRRAGTSFQFPQSERTNCNAQAKSHNHHAILAFSFHNRNERTATETQSLMFLLLLTFSFHNRNERTATTITRDFVVRRNVFQFPQSERTNCNLKIFTSRNRETLFQFPQSERTNCNFVRVSS